jgi:hypothetical protein
MRHFIGAHGADPITDEQGVNAGVRRRCARLNSSHVSTKPVPLMMWTSLRVSVCDERPCGASEGHTVKALGVLCMCACVRISAARSSADAAAAQRMHAVSARGCSAREREGGAHPVQHILLRELVARLHNQQRTSGGQESRAEVLLQRAHARQRERQRRRQLRAELAGRGAAHAVRAIARRSARERTRHAGRCRAVDAVCSAWPLQLQLRQRQRRGAARRGAQAAERHRRRRDACVSRGMRGRVCARWRPATQRRRHGRGSAEWPHRCVRRMRR